MGFAHPFRLRALWLIAAAQAAERRRLEGEAIEAARSARVQAARALLFRDGTMRRVGRVRRAIRQPEFLAGFLSKPRARAGGLEQLAEMAVETLVGMGVDMTDVQLTLRRSAANELQFRPVPSLDVAQRALAAAAQG